MMGYQMSDYELRAGYIAIRTAEDMERISGKKVVATNDYLIQLNAISVSGSSVMTESLAT